jgi:hypothetical protein
MHTKDEEHVICMYHDITRTIAHAGMITEPMLAALIGRLEREAEITREGTDKKALKVMTVLLQLYQEGSPYNPLR